MHTLKRMPSKPGFYPDIDVRKVYTFSTKKNFGLSTILPHIYNNPGPSEEKVSSIVFIIF